MTLWIFCTQGMSRASASFPATVISTSWRPGCARRANLSLEWAKKRRRNPSARPANVLYSSTSSRAKTRPPGADPIPTHLPAHRAMEPPLRAMVLTLTQKAHPGEARPVRPPPPAEERPLSPNLLSPTRRPQGLPKVRRPSLRGPRLPIPPPKCRRNLTWTRTTTAIPKPPSQIKRPSRLPSSASSQITTLKARRQAWVRSAPAWSRSFRILT